MMTVISPRTHRTVAAELRASPLPIAVDTDEHLVTGNDTDNRAAVGAVPAYELSLAGLAIYGARNAVDKTFLRPAHLVSCRSSTRPTGCEVLDAIVIHRAE